MGLTKEQYRNPTAGNSARDLTVEETKAQIQRFFGPPTTLPELTDQQLAEGDQAAERR